MSEENKIKELKNKLRNLLNDCINFDDGNLTEIILKEASELLKKLDREDLELEIYKEVFGRIDLDTPNEIKRNFAIIKDLKTGVSDTLYGLFEQGPLYDGDVCSKQERDVLLDKGYCAKVVVKGQDGYNACTYKGRRLYRCFKALHNLR